MPDRPFLRRCKLQTNCNVKSAVIPFYVSANPFYGFCFSSLLPFISVRVSHVAASMPSPPQVLSGANIGCRACSLRFEVDFLQILPFRERVIGRKKHREWLFRQPFPAPKNPKRLPVEGRRTEGRKNKSLKFKLWTTSKNRKSTDSQRSGRWR